MSEKDTAALVEIEKNNVNVKTFKQRGRIMNVIHIYMKLKKLWNCI